MVGPVEGCDVGGTNEGTWVLAGLERLAAEGFQQRPAMRLRVYPNYSIISTLVWKSWWIVVSFLGTAAADG